MKQVAFIVDPDCDVSHSKALTLIAHTLGPTPDCIKARIAPCAKVLTMAAPAPWPKASPSTIPYEAALIRK